MNLRTPAGAAVIALAAALALTACSSDDGTEATASASASPTASPTANPSPTAQDVAAVAGIKVDGAAGAEPKLVFDAPLSVSVPTARKVSDGKGAALRDGDKVEVQYVVFNSDGSRAGSTWKEGGDKPEAVTMGDPNLGVVNDVLKGTHVGARALVATPTTGQDGQTTTTQVMLLEVASAGKWRADGTPVTPAAGLPTVTLDGNGKPSIHIPDGFKPSDQLVVQPLIKGSGATVTADQTLTVHYTGWLTNGKQFDSSWDRNVPASFALQQVIPGWSEGLAGQTVGSQVLLIVPPAKGYGDKAQGEIPANSTLIFVVDIFDASAS